MKISLGVIAIGAVLLIFAGLYTTGNLYTILDIEEPMPDLVRDTLVWKEHEVTSDTKYMFRTEKMFLDETETAYTYYTLWMKYQTSGLAGIGGNIVQTTGTFSPTHEEDKSLGAMYPYTTIGKKQSVSILHLYYNTDNAELGGAHPDGWDYSEITDFNNMINLAKLDSASYPKYGAVPGWDDFIRTYANVVPSETIVEDCMGTGTVTSLDGSTIKCGSYAKPNVGISIGKEGWKVTPDGSAIDHVVCDYASYNGVCGYSPTQVLHISSAQFTDDFMSGDDISIEVLAYYEDAPLPGALVHGELRKDNVVFAHASGLTGSDGLVTLDFINPQSLGDVYFFASTTYRLMEYRTTGTYMFFDTRPVTAIPSTTSYEQYTDRIIEFTVTIKDENGIGIPSYKLTNMEDISTISGANINNIEITPGGDGVFRIKNAVTGSGKFNGMIKFDYNTITFFSSPILIDVIQPDIAYSITGFGSPPTMWEENLIEMHFTSTSYIDEAVDPETIRVTIIYPDGSTTDIITKEQMNRTEPGYYTFEYVYTQPQQYTFYVRPEHIGYETIEHEKLVIVSAAINPDPTPEPFPTPTPEPGPNWAEIVFEFILQNKGTITSIFIIAIVVTFGAGIIKKRGLL